MQDSEQPTLSASINSTETPDTWNQARSAEQLNSFVEAKLAAKALVDVTL